MIKLYFKIPSERNYKGAVSLFRDAFDTLGYDFEMKLSGSSRSIALATSGAVDGNCGRSYNFGEENKLNTLIRVDVAIAQYYFGVWASADGDYRNYQFSGHFPDGSRVGYLNGYTDLEPLLSDQNIIRIKLVNDEIGYKMLAADRLDFFVGEAYPDEALKKNNLQNRFVDTGAILDLYLYPYLHIKHRLLVDPLAEELFRQIELRGGPIRVH